MYRPEIAQIGRRVPLGGSPVPGQGIGYLSSGQRIADYTPKSITRNRIPGTNCTELAVSCVGHRDVAD
eukprot:3625840-Rhodomonas_salina.3